jgi:hypothetical protein
MFAFTYGVHGARGPLNVMALGTPESASSRRSSSTPSSRAHRAPRADRRETAHVYVDDDTYRRDIKGVRNLQEGRHSLAPHVFHGKKGELYERYHKGMEDQLRALGLVLNCMVLWNTRYMNAALDQSRAEGRTVLDADVARLSPFVRAHLNVHGKYSFCCPNSWLPGCGRCETPATTTPDPARRIPT